MANFDIPENPEFTKEIRKLETTDPAHADVLNAPLGKLLENDLCLMEMLGGNRVVVITLDEYDALPEESKDPQTLYFIMEG